MFSSELTVLDPIGLHARPAGQIVKLVKESGLEVMIGKRGQEPIKASSPLRMIGLQAKTGEVLVVEIQTDDPAVGQQLVSQMQDFLRG
jgi:phosphocarrier protein HPr